MNFDPKKMAGLLTDLLVEDQPETNDKLQDTVGGQFDQATSTFTQFKPETLKGTKANPMSPVEGDEIFFTYMIPGAIFQSHDGSLWNILDYEWDGRVEIENVWYPRTHAQVSLDDIRRSIHAWVVPVQQTVPPPPEGVAYGAQTVKVVK